jgi:hypothetical protein
MLQEYLKTYKGQDASSHDRIVKLQQEEKQGCYDEFYLGKIAKEMKQGCHSPGRHIQADGATNSESDNCNISCHLRGLT